MGWAKSFRGQGKKVEVGVKGMTPKAFKGQTKMARRCWLPRHLEWKMIRGMVPNDRQAWPR